MTEPRYEDLELRAEEPYTAFDEILEEMDRPSHLGSIVIVAAVLVLAVVVAWLLLGYGRG